MMGTRTRARPAEERTGLGRWLPNAHPRSSEPWAIHLLEMGKDNGKKEWGQCVCGRGTRGDLAESESIGKEKS